MPECLDVSTQPSSDFATAAVRRRLAIGVVAASLTIFAATVPFARVQLPAVWLPLAKPYRKIDLARMTRSALDVAAAPAAVGRVA